MTSDNLQSAYDEIVDEIQGHLRRGGTIREAQVMYADFCSQTIVVINQISDLESFLKDIVIALADKFRFNNGELLKGLSDGTSADQLATLRAAKAVSLDSQALVAWRHITNTNPEIAVTVIALSYRLFAEKKLKKLLNVQRELEGEQRILQRQEQEIL